KKKNAAVTNPPVQVARVPSDLPASAKPAPLGVELLGLGGNTNDLKAGHTVFFRDPNAPPPKRIERDLSPLSGEGTRLPPAPKHIGVAERVAPAVAQGFASRQGIEQDVSGINKRRKFKQTDAINH